MHDDPAGVEHHQQALARALGVPDHADAPVALRPRGVDRAVDRMAHGVELVIAGDLLDQLGAIVLEDYEPPDVVQESPLLEHALDQGSQLGPALGRDRGPVHRAPGQEPLGIGGQRAEPRLQPVRGGEHGVGPEQRGDLLLVGLELVEGAAERRVLVARALELDHPEGEAVHEHHHVRAPVVLVLDHRELVDREPVVVVRVVEIDQPSLVARNGAVAVGDLHVQAVHDHAVKAPVFLDQGRRLHLLELGQNLLADRFRQLRVEPRQRRPQAAPQHDLAEVRPLGARAVGRDLGPEARLVAQVPEPLQPGFLDGGFGETLYQPRLLAPCSRQTSSRSRLGNASLIVAIAFCEYRL